MTKRSRIPSLIAPPLIACLALLSGCSRPAQSAPPPAAPSAGSNAVTLTTSPVTAPAPPLAGAPDVAELVARVKPAVVNITTTKDVKVPRLSPFGDWPLGEWFFGPFGGSGRFGSRQGPRGEDLHFKQQALGSGFIVDPRGYAVTNAHVVANADRVRVRLADDRELDAKVKGRDDRLDLAVLEIEGAKDLPSVVLGSSESVRVGDYVIAIGNPFGLGHTVTMGIVSAKSREIGAGPYDDFLQTDASINPGNSGGPLFNTRGEVIGVNTAINPNGQGIGFAIPVDVLKDVVPQLIEKGTVARGRLGVHIQEVDEPLAKALGMDRPRGALVGEVEPNSPADKAGLKPGDVIVRFEGDDVAHSRDLPRMVARRAPGTRVKVEVLRDRSTRTFEVTLDALDGNSKPDERSGDKNGAKDDKDPAERLGIELVENKAGEVVVSRVRPGSRAEGVLQPGDVLLEIDKKPIRQARDATRELGAHRDKPFMVRIKRNGATRYVAIEP